MQSTEARSQVWRGRSTVRTLRAGTRLTVTVTPLQQLGEAAPFAILRVTSVGVNNLPPPARHALAELFGPIPELLQDIVRDKDPQRHRHSKVLAKWEGSVGRDIEGKNKKANRERLAFLLNLW